MQQSIGGVPKWNEKTVTIVGGVLLNREALFGATSQGNPVVIAMDRLLKQVSTVFIGRYATILSLSHVSYYIALV
jgi:hypothetical protein